MVNANKVAGRWFCPGWVAVGVALWSAGGPAAAQAPSTAVITLAAKTGVGRSTAELLTEHVVDEVRASAAFSRVVASAELETVLSLDAQRQLMQCDNASCVMEVTGALGVETMITGSVGRLGRVALLTLRLLDTRSGAARASVSLRVCGDSESNLLLGVPVAVARLLDQAGLKRASRKKLTVNLETCPEAAPVVARPVEAPARAPSGPKGLRAGGAGVLGLGVAAALPVPALLGAAVVSSALLLTPAVLRSVPTPGLAREGRLLLLWAPVAGMVVASLAGATASVILAGSGLTLLVVSVVRGE